MQRGAYSPVVDGEKVRKHWEALNLRLKPEYSDHQARCLVTWMELYRMLCVSIDWLPFSYVFGWTLRSTPYLHRANAHDEVRVAACADAGARNRAALLDFRFDVISTYF